MERRGIIGFALKYGGVNPTADVSNQGKVTAGGRALGCDAAKMRL